MATTTGDGDLAEYYTDLLAEQESSGLSVAEFAADVGLSAATLYAWRRRLSAAPVGAGELVEVQLGGPMPVRKQALALRVGDRFTIEIGSEFDPDALRQVLEVLDGC